MFTFDFIYTYIGVSIILLCRKQSHRASRKNSFFILFSIFFLKYMKFMLYNTLRGRKFVFLCYNKRTWRNWQTRTAKDRVVRALQVRVLLSAPKSIKGFRINAKAFNFYNHILNYGRYNLERTYYHKTKLF